MTNYERGKQLLYGGYTAYTPDLKSRAVKAKRYGKEPRVGAIIEYYVASKGRIGHTGIVVDCEFRNGAYDFHTVEGNSGNAVSIVHHNLTPAQIGGGNHVDGFVYPDFRAETCSAEQLVAIARVVGDAQHDFGRAVAVREDDSILVLFALVDLVDQREHLFDFFTGVVAEHGARLDLVQSVEKFVCGHVRKYRKVAAIF